MIGDDPALRRHADLFLKSLLGQRNARFVERLLPQMREGGVFATGFDASLDELRQFSDQITDDVFAVLTLEGSVNARDHIGGTAPNQVRAAVQRGRELLASR